MNDEERIIWLAAFAAASVSNDTSEWISPSKPVSDHCIELANSAVDNFRIAKCSHLTPPGIFK